MKNRTYLIDTNIILLDSNCINHYPNSEIIIPLFVIEKVGSFRNNITTVGRNARVFLERLENLSDTDSLIEGARLPNKSILKVYFNKLDCKLIPEHLNLQKNSNLMLATAIQIQAQKKQMTLISNDLDLRVRVKIFNIHSQPFEKKDTIIEELYKPIPRLFITDKQRNELKISDAIYIDIKDGYSNKHYYVEDADSKIALLRYYLSKKKLKRVANYSEQSVWNIKSRNIEQGAAIDLLMDKKVQVVFLLGKAGTGKTLLALASALEQIITTDQYYKILVTRPLIPIGKDVGYLPGDLMDKISPWMQPIADNLDFISSQSKSVHNKINYNNLIKNGILEIEALTYIRGRSIPNSFIIVDEAQNLNPSRNKDDYYSSWN